MAGRNKEESVNYYTRALLEITESVVELLAKGYFKYLNTSNYYAPPCR